MTNGDALMDDPDYGTDEQATMVHDAILALAEKINAVEPTPTEILQVIKGPEGPFVVLEIRERDARILKFALGLALETF
jgi:hypothetical protein